MPKPFIPLTLAQFAELVRTFAFTRTISAVHMHHTWRPNHAQYKGVASIEGMWRDHIQNRCFADIAQHITIAPDGTIWTGRSWNRPPASAIGNNGNSSFGPFMFEMIGDFDQDKDLFQDPQRNVAIQVIAIIQQRFALLPETLKFHNQMSSKSCPVPQWITPKRSWLCRKLGTQLTSSVVAIQPTLKVLHSAVRGATKGSRMRI